MAISSLGIGSGIDIGSLVSQLVASQVQPQDVRLTQKEAGIQARLSGFSALKGALSAFNSSLSSLQTSTSFQSKKASSSDSSILTVSSSSAAMPGSYDVTTTQLAAAHKLATDPLLANAQFKATTDTLSTGTLTFKFGTTVYDKGTDTYTSFSQDASKATKSVEITDSSLQGIRDAVNSANIGVSSSIVFDGANYRLAFVSDTGVASSLEISVADNDGNNTDASGLSLLAFNSTANHMEQTGAAQDTIASVNGIIVTSDKTSFANVVGGVTLNILDLGTATVNVSVDKASVNSSIKSFVSNYNTLVNTINDLGSYDIETKKSGVLNGDSILRGVDTQIRRLLGNVVPGVTGPFRVLADIGISRDAANGTMKIDQTKLDNAITTDLEAVGSIFSAFGKVDDPLVTLDSSTRDTKVGNYALNISQLASQGMLSGSAAANLTISLGVNDGLSFTIDGVSSSITLSSGTYTAASLVSELQARINGTTAFSGSDVSVKVSETGGVISIESNRYGSASNVGITGGNGMTDLIGATPTATIGIDVAGTIGGTAATGSGQYLTGSGDTKGMKLLIEGATLGMRGNINFSRGYADQLSGHLNKILGNSNIFDTIDKSLNEDVARINEQRERLQVRADSIHKRLLAQFSAMDALVGRMKSTGNYLTQQLDRIGQISLNKN